MESEGGLVGVVTLCGDVGLVGGGSRMVRLTGLDKGSVSTGGDDKEGPSQLICTVSSSHTQKAHTSRSVVSSFNCIDQCCMKTLRHLLSR